MVIIRVELPNPSGLHARPASKLCAIAKKHKSECLLLSENATVDIKKILDLMAANFRQGTCLEIRCSGPDEHEAAEKIREFISELDE
ncbi:MAG: HPr family phosphocarrier protein [Clostridiaceae bacterium]|nr:HPr family phosphocarrier protein [Clostridiaceae bacterium]